MYHSFLKRVFDFIIAALGMLPFAVLLIPISIAIWVEDKGSIFYLGERLGRNGKIFKMYKFRSMRMNAPDIRNDDGSTYNSADDPRLTKVGKFLRETSMDEIPQLINILRGEMSFIGPRPSLPDDMPTYRPDERLRLLVRPGISGYSQAFYRNAISCRNRRLLDAWYAQNLRFGLDMRIIFATFGRVFRRDSVYSIDIHSPELSIRPEDREKITKGEAER